jgi:hypothetical protein
MCGRERLVGKITDCKELNQNDYVEFRKQPWWDEFCEEYTKVKCYGYVLGKLSLISSK